MKGSRIRISDLVTTTRIVLVSIFAVIVSYRQEFFGEILGVILILVMILTDTLDGIIARKFDESSEFGAFYDIVGDRIAEIVLLIPFVYLNLVSPIVIIYFIVKGFLVDYQRLYRYVQTREAPFKQLHGKASKFLIASPFMRQLYLISKIAMIIIFYLRIFSDSEFVTDFSHIIPWLTIFISLLRTVPVFFA
jgi:CDP-diacylglycerol--glycerol-3-phosphate 3-phosphatidyltransferase